MSAQRGAPLTDHGGVTTTVDAVATYTLHRGSSPLLVSLPHVGIRIPYALQPRYQPRALDVEDTDWHLERLYDVVRGLGASLIVPVLSRYVIDLNRPRENQPMYPGVNNTELCPTRFFTGEPLYRMGQAPDDVEIEARIAAYWQPYHDALRTELDRLRAAYGHAVLFDGHSIHSELPWLFPGRLPDLNLGTVDGRSCAPSLRQALAACMVAAPQYTQVVDGRFKGGHITRHYGRPDDRIHAVQLEMCWRCYMSETPPYLYDEHRAAQVQPLLRRMIETMIGWAPDAR